MKTVAEKIRELKEKEEQIKGMGGAKAVEKQRQAASSRPGSVWICSLTRGPFGRPIFL